MHFLWWICDWLLRCDELPCVLGWLLVYVVCVVALTLYILGVDILIGVC